MKSPRSERASILVDAMTGVTLLMQGLSETGAANGSRPLAVVAVTGGAFIVAGTIFRRRIEGRFRHFHAMVSFFEGLTCAFVGIASMQRGTNYIQFAWLIAAIAFLVATVVRVRRTHRSSMTPFVATGE